MLFKILLFILLWCFVHSLQSGYLKHPEEEKTIERKKEAQPNIENFSPSFSFNGSTYSILYNSSSGLLKVFYNDVLIISDAYSIVLNGNMTLNSTAYTTRTINTTNFSDNFGTGIIYTVISIGNDMPQMQQVFYIYSGRSHFFIEVYINGSQLSSNYMAPLVSSYVNIQTAGDVRALFVPFDNDAWIRYDARSLASSLSITSAEVGVIYDNDLRKGLITGSIEHDTWKTGVRAKGTGAILNELTVFGGYSDSGVTRDQKSHGSISGNLLKSPKIFVGYYNDWRQGLEDYAKANRLATPKYIFDWSQPVPFGWNSWGEIKTSISLSKANAVVDFFANQLPEFRSGNTLYIDLDSYWDNLAVGGMTGDFTQLAQFANYSISKGLKPGVYWAPFVDWGKSSRNIENSTWNYQNAWLKQNGNYHDFDGCRAMDPTHPGTQQRIAYLISKFKSCGFKMIKIDFLGHAAIEADSYYDPTVKTGMQAFKKGMEFLVDQLAGQMLVYAAISPNLATSSYVHMRRIACDAESSIGASQYTLNSVNYGWWQTYMYNYIDADTLVFRNETEGTNRARFTSGIVTGTLITGDDFSAPSTSLVDRAKRILQNKPILEISRQGNGKAFRPVEGNTGNDTSSLFVKKLGRNFYLAVFNFDSTAKYYTISLSRIGLTGGLYTAMELYSNNSVVADKTLNISFPASDAAIYRFNNCPDGWALSTISNNTCYLVISEKDNWQIAENKCLAQSTSLASIDNAFENNQINDLIANNTNCEQSYIGLYNSGNNDWAWINNDTSTYRNWKNGYPSNNSSNNVAVINQGTGKWTNEDGSISRCYICKMILDL